MMRFYKNTRFLVSILLVATCKQKIAVAYDEPTYQGVRSSLNHREAPTAIGDPGTQVKSKAHIGVQCHESSFTQNTFGDGKSDLRGKSSSISDERKQQIQDKLKENEQQVKMLRPPLNSLRKSIQNFEEELKRELENSAETEESKRIWSNLHDLKSFHKHYFSSLIRDRLYKLGGIGSSMVRIGPGPEQNRFEQATSFLFQGKAMYRLDNPHAGKKPHLVPVGTPHEPQSTPPRKERYQGKQMTEVSAKTSGVRVNEQDRQGVRNSQVLTKPKTTESLPEARELPEDISKIISNQARVGMVKDLKEILHKSIFPNLEQYTIDFKQKLLYLKTSSEQLVFRTLRFLYVYQLIAKEEYGIFFDSLKTLELIATHLRESYKSKSLIFFAFDASVPHWNFLTEKSRKEFIDELFDGLAVGYRKRFSYAGIKVAIKEIDERLNNAHRSLESLQNNELFLYKDFLNVFDEWPSLKPDLPAQLLPTLVSSVVKIHESLLTNNDIRESLTRRIEFWINSQILFFMKLHGNLDVIKLIQQHSTTDKHRELMDEFKNLSEGDL